MIATLAVLALGTAFAAAETTCVIHPDNIISVRVLDGEVEIAARCDARSMNWGAGERRTIGFRFPFELPPDVRKQMYIRSLAYGFDQVTVTLGFGNATTAAEFVALVESNRAKESNADGLEPERVAPEVSDVCPSYL